MQQINTQDAAMQQNNQDATAMAQDNAMGQNANPYYQNAPQPQMAQNVNPYYQNVPQNTSNPFYNNTLFSSLNTMDFLKGALIGAAAGYLLTNEKAQKTIMKTVAKGSQMMQAGVEEMKERFEDVKAEMQE